jgi:hypothetical protein
MAQFMSLRQLLAFSFFLAFGLVSSGCGVQPAPAAQLSPDEVAATATSCTCSTTGEVNYAYEKAAEFSLPQAGGPAGLVFHPGRKSLFIAAKEGQVIETDQAGQVLQQRLLPDTELAGITYYPAVDLLYLVRADGTGIFEVEPADLAVRREISLAGAWPEGGDAFGQPESLTFVAEAGQPGTGLFYLAARGEPAKALVLELVIEAQPAARLNRNFTLNVPSLVDLVYDPANGGLLALSDSTSLLFHFDPMGQMRETQALQSQGQAALALGEAQVLYISEASDRVVKYQPVKSGL